MPSKSGHGRVLGAVLSERLSLISGSRASRPRPCPRPRQPLLPLPPRPSVERGGVPLLYNSGIPWPPPAPLPSTPGAASPLAFPLRAGEDQAEHDGEVTVSVTNGLSVPQPEPPPPLPPPLPAPPSCSGDFLLVVVDNDVPVLWSSFVIEKAASPSPSSSPLSSLLAPPPGAAAGGGSGAIDDGEGAANSLRRGRIGAEVVLGMGCGGVATTRDFASVLPFAFLLLLPVGVPAAEEEEA